MTVTGENALQIGCWGATTFWLVVLGSATHDAYAHVQHNVNGKDAWMNVVVLLAAFCGTAFYLMIAPPVFRYWRSRPAGNAPGRWYHFIWALSPIPLILIAAGLVLYLIATRN